jgi:monolysocardiolipin acyltransferase
MRYFKWGVARLILESEPCPDVVPMFISGFSNVMHEERTFPTFLPRPGHDIEITFGTRIARDTLEGFRARWRRLREKSAGNEELLRDGVEARRLRIEIAGFIRGEVQKLRKERGWPEDDPKGGLVETWIEEGDMESKTGKKKDGSILGDQ